MSEPRWRLEQLRGRPPEEPDRQVDEAAEDAEKRRIMAEAIEARSLQEGLLRRFFDERREQFIEDFQNIRPDAPVEAYISAKANLTALQGLEAYLQQFVDTYAHDLDRRNRSAR